MTSRFERPAHDAARDHSQAEGADVMSGPQFVFSCIANVYDANAAAEIAAARAVGKLGFTLADWNEYREAHGGTEADLYALLTPLGGRGVNLDAFDVQADGEAEGKKEPPKIGQRVRFSNDFDIFPFCIVPKGAMGTVTKSDPEAPFYAVQLDIPIPELADGWENEAHLMEDHGDPWQYVELLPPAFRPEFYKPGIVVKSGDTRHGHPSGFEGGGYVQLVKEFDGMQPGTRFRIEALLWPDFRRAPVRVAAFDVPMTKRNPQTWDIDSEYLEATPWDTRRVTDSDIEAAARMSDLDAACYHLQTIAAITDGGGAGMHFSGCDNDEKAWKRMSRDERKGELREWLRFDRGPGEFDE